MEPQIIDKSTLTKDELLALIKQKYWDLHWGRPRAQRNYLYSIFQRACEVQRQRKTLGPSDAWMAYTEAEKAIGRETYSQTAEMAA